MKGDSTPRSQIASPGAALVDLFLIPRRQVLGRHMPDPEVRGAVKWSVIQGACMTTTGRASQDEQTRMISGGASRSLPGLRMLDEHGLFSLLL